MNTQTITEIYQKIGRLLRAEGADRISILNSKILCADPWKLSMELVVDRVRSMPDAEKALRQAYPDFTFTLIDGSDPDNYEILEEGGIEGIKL